LKIKSTQDFRFFVKKQQNISPQRFFVLIFDFLKLFFEKNKFSTPRIVTLHYLIIQGFEQHTKIACGKTIQQVGKRFCNKPLANILKKTPLSPPKNNKLEYYQEFLWTKKSSTVWSLLQLHNYNVAGEIHFVQKMWEHSKIQEIL
jgi:hypothetical protein